MIRGQFEMSDPSRIAGWALDASNPTARLLVEIYLGESKLGETIAGSEQGAVAPLALGAEGHAFEIPLRSPIGPDDRARIRAIVTPVVEVDEETLLASQALILQSGLFDPGFYGGQAGQGLSTQEMIRHYLSRGETEGVRPHPLFEPAFVRDQFVAAGIELAPGGVLATYLAHPDLEIDPHPLFDTGRLRRTAQRPLPVATGLKQYLSGAPWKADESPCVLFDVAYYLGANADVARSGMDPLLHYAAFGGAEGRAPHPLFLASYFRESLEARGIPHPADEVLLGFYLRAPESWAAAPHPLFDPEQYAASLASRGPPTSWAEPPLVAAVRQDELPPRHWFDPPYYRAQAAREGAAVEGPALLHYLRHGARCGFDPHPLFSVRRYLADHPDLAPFGRDPLVHFLEAIVSGRDGPAQTNASIADAARTELRFGSDAGDAILANEDRLSRDPHELFEARLYAAQRPGRLAKGASPLAHYARAWGSNGLRMPPWGTAFHPRRNRPDEHGPFDVVFISHELSRTGAPAILLKIIEDLACRRGVRGLTLALNGGARMEEFLEWAPVVDMAAIRAAGVSDAAFLGDLVGAFSPSARPKLVIANTACVDQVAAPFAEAGIPVVTLVHEIASAFEAPVFESIYACSKRVIYPAAFVRDEAHRAHVLPLDRDAVAPQGLLEPTFGRLDRESARRKVIAELGLPDDAFIVLGAGTIDLRKGVDVFVRVAASVLRAAPGGVDAGPIHFVWLGDGDRSPHSPFSYFMEDAQRLGVAPNLHFPGARASPEPYFVASDVFLLPSRLDPFPCVVHEAMACSKPVVAFAGAGGAPEALADGAGVVVDYGDIEAMARAVCELAADTTARLALGERARARVASTYVFADYVDRLVGLIGEAAEVDLGAPRAAPRRAKADARRVLFTTSRWEPSAQTTFVGDLIEGLRRRDFDAELVLTTRDPAVRSIEHLPDVPTTILPETLRRPSSRSDAWRQLGALLDGAGHVVLAPVFDDIAEALVPVAPATVGVLGIVFDLDPGRDERMARLGRHYQRIVTGAEPVAEAIRSIAPGSERQIRRIPWGVLAPTDVALRPARGALRVLCRGGSMVSPMAAGILRELVSSLSDRTDVEFTFMSRPSHGRYIQDLFPREIASGRLAVILPQGQGEERRVMEAHDVLFVLPGCEIDGLEVLSAMSAGLALLAFEGDPVAGPYVIDTGNGFFTPPGDIAALTARLLDLADRPDRRALLGQGARETIRARGFDLDRVCDNYSDVLEEMFAELRSGAHVRPPPVYFHPEVGGMSLPPSLIRHPDAVEWPS